MLREASDHRELLLQDLATPAVFVREVLDHRQVVIRMIEVESLKKGLVRLDVEYVLVLSLCQRGYRFLEEEEFIQDQVFHLYGLPFGNLIEEILAKLFIKLLAELPGPFLEGFVNLALLHDIPLGLDWRAGCHEIPELKICLTSMFKCLNILFHIKPLPQLHIRGVLELRREVHHRGGECLLRDLRLFVFEESHEEVIAIGFPFLVANLRDLEGAVVELAQ